MADADVAITAGTGTKIDTRTVGAGTDEHRQVVVIGDPVTAANVAAVDPTFGLEVQVAGQSGTTATGNITTSSTSIPATVTAYGNATITIKGTHAGITVVFEASDDGGTTYFPVQVQRESDGAVVSTEVLATNASVMYCVDLPGITQIRVRSTAFTSGSGAVRITPGGMPFMPVVSIGNLASANGVQSSVAATVTGNTTLLAANSLRKGATIFNESTSMLRILLGAGTQSSTVYTTQIAPNGYYEVPYGFTGRISGNWVTAVGSARITEFTP